MTERTVTAATFEADCLALLDHVAATGEPIVITKGGRPVARVAPVETPRSLLGTVTFNVTEDELIHAPLDDWRVERA